MAETSEKIPTEGGERALRVGAPPNAVEDAGTIPKGTIDPVYEAKARVLNHAVSTQCGTERPGRGT